MFGFKKQNNSFQSLAEQWISDEYVSIGWYKYQVLSTNGLLITKHSLHKKWGFPLRISSVNVTRSAVSWVFGHITEEILNGKLHFLCSDFGFCQRHIKSKVFNKWLHCHISIKKQQWAYCHMFFLWGRSNFIFSNISCLWQWKKIDNAGKRDQV